MKIIEYWSNLKLILRSNVIVLVHCQFVEITSTPWSRKMHSGIKLIKNAIWTAVFTWVRAQSFFCGVGESDIKIG